MDDDFVSSELLIKTRTFENDIESEVLGGSFVIALVWCELVKTKVKTETSAGVVLWKAACFSNEDREFRTPIEVKGINFSLRFTVSTSNSGTARQIFEWWGVLFLAPLFLLNYFLLNLLYFCKKVRGLKLPPSPSLCAVPVISKRGHRTRGPKEEDCRSIALRQQLQFSRFNIADRPFTCSLMFSSSGMK